MLLDGTPFNPNEKTGFQSPFNRVKECYDPTSLMFDPTDYDFQSPFNRVKECYWQIVIRGCYKLNLSVPF